MLCRQRPAHPMEDPNEAIHAIRSFPMSMTSTIRLLKPSGSLRHARQSRSRPQLPALLGKLFNWLERRRQCHALGDRADDKHLLADIGLTRAQALREANRWFWPRGF